MFLKIYIYRLVYLKLILKSFDIKAIAVKVKAFILMYVKYTAAISRRDI